MNWKGKASKAREEADAQEFQIDFLNIFGVPRNKVAIFEHKVKLLYGSAGYIDLLWKWEYYSNRGLEIPKRCQSCRGERKDCSYSSSGSSTSDVNEALDGLLSWFGGLFNF